MTIHKGRLIILVTPSLFHIPTAIAISLSLVRILMEGETGKTAFTESAGGAKFIITVGGVFATITLLVLILRRHKQSATYLPPYNSVPSQVAATTYQELDTPTTKTLEKKRCEGDIAVEKPSSKEEELTLLIKGNSKQRRNFLKSQKRPPVVLEDSTDDDKPLRSLRNSHISMERRKTFKASLREDETGYQYTDKEEDRMPPSPRASTKVKRERRSPSGNPPYELLADIQGLVNASNSHIGPRLYAPNTSFFPQHNPYCPMCGRHFPIGPDGRSHENVSNLQQCSSMHTPNPHFVPSHNPYRPGYGPPFSFPIGPYGYGTVVYPEVRTTTISNIGNNNSVKKTHRAARSRSTD